MILVSTSDDASNSDRIIGAAILSYALWRTIRPVNLSGGTAELVAVLAESAVVVTAVLTTGYWDSPFAFCLVTAICTAGFSGGISRAFQVAAGCVIAVAVPYHLAGDSGAKLSVQWAGELVLVAMLAGYVRRLSLQAREETSRYVGRLHQLTEVNDLLLQLRNVAQDAPMSLDLADTLESSAARLHQLFEPDTAVVLLHESELWTVTRSRGAHLPRQLTTGDLPPVLRRAVDGTEDVLPVSAHNPSQALLNLDSRFGLYGRLSARNELVGLVALERQGGPFSEHDQVVLQQFCQQMAMAVDNARWFSRIGTLAAEQERSRIARDLHDRVGQSLALVGFELDRVTKKDADPSVTAQLMELREHISAVVRELRETLHDLRTDVSEDHDLTEALAGFLGRVAERSNLDVRLEHNATQRLSLNVEREVWRIAQEAVFNAERHAGATSIAVAWTSDETGAELSVEDNGQGMARSAADRGGGYGLVGMQERARAIDAALTFNSLPGRGTTVRLKLRR